MNLQEIHTEIERASERRTELYRLLSEGHDPETIVKRARLEERLERAA